MYFIKGVGVLDWASQVALVVKNPPDNASRRKRWGFDPWVRKTPWRRAQQPTPVFLPGESHGKKSLTHRYNNVVFLFKVLASLFLNHLKLAQVSRNYHIINDEEILYNWKQMLSFFRNWWGVWRKKKDTCMDPEIFPMVLFQNDQKGWMRRTNLFWLLFHENSH